MYSSYVHYVHVPPFVDDGPKEEGLVVLENLPYLLQCGVSVSSMDLVSPHLLGGAVWSWSPGYPGEVASTHIHRLTFLHLN